MPLSDWLLMVLPAIGMLLVAFSQSLAVAHEYSDKHDYDIDSNTELGAYSAINVASGLFGGQIGGGSIAPSAVNDGAGGRSLVAELVDLGGGRPDAAVPDAAVRRACPRRSWPRSSCTRCGTSSPRASSATSG